MPLHYNWHRYYDPSTGRYITSDPIGVSGGSNSFAYSELNPLRYMDPSGLKTTCTCTIVCWAGGVLARCSRVEECVDSCDGTTTRKYWTAWYIWYNRPFWFVGMMECSAFPFDLPGNPGLVPPPMIGNPPTPPMA